MTNKKGRTSRHSPNQSQCNGNSAADQRQRTEQALRIVPSGLNTIELREQYDVMMPAARVHELRWQFDLNIQTIWSHDVNAQGNRHKVGRYVLQPGKWSEKEGGRK